MLKCMKFGFLLLGIALFAVPGVAAACPNCYGVIGDSEIAAGIRIAMLALVGVTGFVGTGIVLFFTNMRKRAKKLEDEELVVTPD